MFTIGLCAEHIIALLDGVEEVHGPPSSLIVGQRVELRLGPTLIARCRLEQLGPSDGGAMQWGKRKILETHALVAIEAKDLLVPSFKPPFLFESPRAATPLKWSKKDTLGSLFKAVPEGRVLKLLVRTSSLYCDVSVGAEGGAGAASSSSAAAAASEGGRSTSSPSSASDT